jgi:hypothetical protein
MTAPVAQLDRVLPSEGRGFEFKSRRVHFFFQNVKVSLMPTAPTAINRMLLNFEFVVLAFGWLWSVFFFLYAEGVFHSSYQWTGYEFGFVIYFAMLAIPYLILGLFCWLQRRFAGLFLLASTGMIACSCYLYYNAYILHPQEGSEWVFMAVPILQTAFSVVLGLFIYGLSKLAFGPPKSDRLF